jgi:hypothetical protein
MITASVEGAGTTAAAALAPEQPMRSPSTPTVSVAVGEETANGATVPTSLGVDGEVQETVPGRGTTSDVLHTSTRAAPDDLVGEEAAEALLATAGVIVTKVQNLPRARLSDLGGAEEECMSGIMPSDEGCFNTDSNTVFSSSA